MNFWNKLEKPIIGMSPMDGVTDFPYRKIVKKYGKPDVMFTEFTHVKGLWFGKLDVYKDLEFDEIQRPIVAQVFGNEPEYFYKIAHIICELGFDGIDINMGCPSKSVVEKGGGADLINKPKLAQEIIRRTKEGIKDWSQGQTLENIGLDKEKIEYISKQYKPKNPYLTLRLSSPLNSNGSKRKTIPVSVKTRLGYKKNTVKDWVKYLIEEKIDAITVHGRTYRQMYTGIVDWDSLSSVAEDIKKMGIIYLGNGDVENRKDGEEKCRRYGLDGVLIGRKALGNPFVFTNKIPDKNEGIKIMTEHAKIYDKFHNGDYFYAFRKHFGFYVRGFDGAKELRIKLMQVESLGDMEKILDKYI